LPCGRTYVATVHCLSCGSNFGACCYPTGVSGRPDIESVQRIGGITRGMDQAVVLLMSAADGPAATQRELSGRQTFSQCSGSGGNYQGDGSNCGFIQCPQPTGACCYPSGSCQDGMTLSQCSASGGTYQGDGSNCSLIQCPQRPGPAACPAGDAKITRLKPVRWNWRTYQGNGSSCGLVTCTQPSGACCLPAAHSE